MITFQQIILRLQEYWDKQGCALLQPYDMEVGAGTSHTATFLRAIGPEPWKAAYVQPSRRPKDGRYGENPNRMQHYYQYQVVHAVRVLAVATVLRAAAWLDVGRLPWLRADGAQEGRGVRGAGADFHVVGLQERAALFVPIFLQAQNDLLKRDHHVCSCVERNR